MIISLGDDADFKINDLIGEGIFTAQDWAAACRSDAVVPVVQAQDGAAALLQFVVMTLCGHLFLSVVGGVEAEELWAGSGEPRLFVFQEHIVAAVVGTVLLWTNVIFVQALLSGAVDAVGGGATLIWIAVHVLLQSRKEGVHISVQVDVREVVLAISAAVLPLS